MRDTVRQVTSGLGRLLSISRWFGSPFAVLPAACVTTLVSLYAASLLFPGDAGLVAVFLVSLWLVPGYDHFLEENRRAIWDEKASPTRANLRLAARVLLLFAGVFIAYGVVALLLPAGRVPEFLGAQLQRFSGTHSTLQKLHFGSFESLARRNLSVAAIFFLLSIFYRSGGSVLAIAWNASVWSSCLAWMSRLSSDEAGPAVVYVKVLAAVSPHMVGEVAGYVLASMAGIFLSRGLVKYPLGSDRFQRVGAAVLGIAVAAAGLVALSAWLEATLAPGLLRALFA